MSGQLGHNPADIVAQLLDDLGLANIEDTGTGDPLTGWTVFSIHLPESPEQAILVKDTEARMFGRLQPTGVTTLHYGIQVLCRSSVDPVTPFKRAKLILEYFDTEVRREIVTLYNADDGLYWSYRVNSISAVTPAIPAGQSGRQFFFSGNATASIELVETGTGS